MTRPPRVVVVVAYGRPDLLEDTLKALGREESVLIVDNSTDATIAELAATWGAEYLDAGYNRGFAGGVNLALDRLAATARYADVLLLNPDAEITSSQFDELQDALHAADHIAAVSPALEDAEGRPQRVQWPFPSPSGMWREAFRAPRKATTGFVIGAVLLLRRSALEQVGRLDERYFLYAEEADWQRRAADHGWRSAEVPSVRARHLGAATSTDSVARDARFLAAQETYIRRWFGLSGWLSYRAAALTASALRAAVLPGPRRVMARERAKTIAQGPGRRAPLPPAGRPLRITHVVVTSNLAGTERYVATLAAAQAKAGHDVRVIGGDPDAMPSLLGSAVTWKPGSALAQALRELWRGGPRDIVHTHLTDADFVGALSGSAHGARLVSTRHIAAARGSSPAAKLVMTLLQRRIDVEICASRFARDRTGRAGAVVAHGVEAGRNVVNGDRRRLVVAQRVEAEKRTDLALEAWCRSGLGEQGWTLSIAGDGSQRRALQEASDSSAVEWLGWVDDVAGLLADSAGLVAPSPDESFGLGVVEAMSVGLPVLAAAAGGHLETVGTVPGALMFAPDDVDDCVRALQRFAAMTADERATYGRALQSAQRARFDLARHVAEVEAVYRSIGPRT